jgi:predicted PurR-regulated permease PerM
MESPHDQGQERVQRVLFYGFLLLIGAGVYTVTRPFLVPLAWAGVLAICCWPLHRRVAKHLPATIAAGVSTAVVTLVLLVPTVLVLVALARQGAGAVDLLQKAFAAGIPAPLADAYAWVADWLPLPPLAEATAHLQQLLSGAVGTLASRAGSVFGAIFTVVFELVMTGLALFFCFRDGPAMVRGLLRLLPINPAHRQELAVSLQELIHASVTSGVIVAAIQGLLGGIIFAVLGIQAAIFWGVVMGTLSLFPLIGSWLVWAPVAIWLFATGQTGAAIGLTLCGVILIGGIDNVLRPILIGGRAQMGMLPLLIGLLGGVSAFGFIGLVLGPVVLAIATSLIRVYAPVEPAPTEHLPAEPPATPPAA